MSDIICLICPKCGDSTDRIYELPYGCKEKGWMCESCVLARCNVAHHWNWSDEDFANAGVEKKEKKQ